MTTQILPAIAAIIFNTERQVLLQHRKDVGQWGIISGHVEFGESVTDAVLREIREETNAQASIVRLVGIYSAPHSQTYHYEDKTVQYVTSYFEARLTEEVDLQFHNNETGALQFFSPQQLPESLAQMHESWLQDALANTEVPFLR
jgi:8-oxo-dGTP diphosphatase